MVDLSARRAEAQAELERIEIEQASALLDGGRPQKGQGDATRLRNEIGVIDRAEGIATERERHAAEQARLAGVAAEKQALAEDYAIYLETVEAIQDHERRLVARLGMALTMSERIARRIRRITDGRVPSGASPLEVERRLARYLDSVMSSVPGRRHRLGHLSWRAAGLDKAADDQRLKEERVMAGALGNLIDGITPRPKTDALQIEDKTNDRIKLNGTDDSNSKQ